MQKGMQRVEYGADLAVAHETGRVLDYYALAAGAVAHVVAPRGVRRNMPDPVPVLSSGGLPLAAARKGRDQAQPCCKTRSSGP